MAAQIKACQRNWCFQATDAGGGDEKWLDMDSNENINFVHDIYACLCHEKETVETCHVP